MAMIRTIVCIVCGRKDMLSVNSGMPDPVVCNECKKLENDCKRREHFYVLDGLTIEKQLRKIEKWLYAYKPSVDPMTVRY